jgi:two-component system sensor histidine kinase AlgZ
MNPKPPGPAVLAEEPRQLYLPNFCAASSVLVIVVICELTALLLALARNSAALGFWSDLGLTSMFLLWIALCGAGLLCVLRNYLAHQSVAVSAAVVIAISVALVVLV